ISLSLYIYIHIQWGKEVFDPLPISQVWPLAKKCVIYNCNGRSILTVRDKNIQKTAFYNSYELICICHGKQVFEPLPNSKSSGSHRPVMCPRSTQISPHKVHLISTGDVYKRILSKESYFTPSTSPPWARPMSWPRTSEISLRSEEHRG